MKVCAHQNAVPVESGGEIVAALCPDCDAQLPASWIGCGHPETVDVSRLGDQGIRYLCLSCNGFFMEPR